MAQHGIASISEFGRKLEVRIGEAIDRRKQEIPEDEEEHEFDRLAPGYDQWTNRFNIRWSPSSPRRQWRALFTLDNLDALLFAGWFIEGSEMHQRLQNALRLQDALRLRGGYEDIEKEFTFDQPGNLMEVYDTLSWALADSLRGHPESRHWSYERITSLARVFTRNALPALADIGIIDLPDDWQERITGPGDHTRGGSALERTPNVALHERIYHWAQLMLEDEITRGRVGSPGDPVGNDAPAPSEAD
jgi:hypothetical protein